MKKAQGESCLCQEGQQIKKLEGIYKNDFFFLFCSKVFFTFVHLGMPFK